GDLVMAGGLVRRGLAEQEFAYVGLQQERFGHFEAVEHPDDIAILQSRLLPADGAVGLLLQPILVHGHVLYELAVGARDRDEKGKKRPIWPQEPRQRLAECLARRRIEVIEEVPAQDAVDTSSFVFQTPGEDLRKGRGAVP